jgi:L-ascorbate metabolism protein UlaG (beta-lactamase superfamily)
VKLTKHEHACVVAEKDGTSIVIDPGSFSPSAAEIIAGGDVILITHEHADHVHSEAINAALADRPDLKLYAPEALRRQLDPRPDQFIAVAAGDELKIGSFDITVHGAEHALIHESIPIVPNIGYLLDGTVYHPGDAYFVPDAAVTTLLLPTSGPWMKFGEAIDYVLAVKPQQAVAIHDALLSDAGQHLAGALLGQNGPSGVPLTQVALGQSLTV